MMRITLNIAVSGSRIPGIANISRLKSIFYPQVLGMKAGTERCATHSDFGLLTLLRQDEGGGLEVGPINNSTIN